jgi:hypothetical protein
LSASTGRILLSKKSFCAGVKSSAAALPEITARKNVSAQKNFM